MKLSEYKKKKVIHLYNQGLKRSEIAEHTNLTLNQVKFILDKGGVTRGSIDKSKFTTIEKKIIRMYQTEYTAGQIVEITGWKMNRLLSFLYRNKIYKSEEKIKEQKVEKIKNINIPFSDNENDKMIDYWREGLKYTEIAKHLQRSANSVKQEMKRLLIL